MIRINVGISPEVLTDQLLLIEHKHLSTLPTLLDKVHITPPDTFQLDWGHVPFMLHHAGYTLRRYISIHDECKSRNLKVKNFIDRWDVYKEYAGFVPTLEMVNAVRNRLLFKMSKTYNHTYKGQHITPLFFTNLLYKNDNFN